MTPRLGRVLGCAAAATVGIMLAVVLAAAPAQAAATGQIESSRVTDGQLEVVFSASAPTAGGLDLPVEVDPASVTVTLQPKGGAARRLDPQVAGQGSAARTVMLVLDTSESMGDGLIDAEKRAALDFVADVPAGTRVGLIHFGTTVEVVRRPTTHYGQLSADIRGLTLNGNTALYRSIVVAAQTLRQVEGFRMIVLITDGEDDPYGDGDDLDAQQRTVQNRLKKQVQEYLTDDELRINFRGVKIGDEAGADLYEAAPAGTVLRGGSDDLAAQLKQIVDSSTRVAQSLLKLTAPVPADLLGSGIATVTVQAQTADGERVTRSIPTNLGRAAPTPGAARLPASADPPLAASFGTPVLIGSLAALFVGASILLLTATGALAGAKDGESEVLRRLSVYTIRGRQPERVAVTEQATRLGQSRLTKSAVSFMSRVARKGRLDDALDARLEAAGLPLRTAEWMLLHTGSAVGAALLLLVASRGAVAAGTLGLVLGLSLPWLFLMARTARRERKFLAQLPDTLQLLAGSLAAGYSLPQAMDSVVRESEPPISTEFNRALIEARLGMPPEDALDGIAARTGSRDFSWIVIAIRIQRDVGGNLAELLSTVADTLRERERLRRQVSALSAEGRLSGIILGALPVVFAVFLLVAKPEYIAPLLHTRLGWLLLAGGVVLLAVGAFWMSRVVKVEV